MTLPADQPGWQGLSRPGSRPWLAVPALMLGMLLTPLAWGEGAGESDSGAGLLALDERPGPPDGSAATMMGPSDDPEVIRCTLADCEPYQDWVVGKTVLANGRVVYVAETPAFWGDQAQHFLAFVYTPGRCEMPMPYFRYPQRIEQTYSATSFAGRFRINAADWYDFKGRLFFPPGRMGTGYFDSIAPSLEQFVAAVKSGKTLNSLSAPLGATLMLHEYRLDGSKAALVAAQRQCEQAPVEFLPAAPTPLPEQATPEHPGTGNGGERQTQTLEALGPLSPTCQDLSFLDNPLIANEFDHLNRRLQAALGVDLEGLGIPYEAVCQDLLDGFSADGLAESLIEKYRPSLP